MQWVPSLYRG